MLLLLLWTYQTMMSTAKGDLSIITPAKYLRTEQELAESDRPVYVWPGMIMDTYYRTSQDPMDRKISRRLVSSWDNPSMSSLLTKKDMARIATSNLTAEKVIEKMEYLKKRYREKRRAIALLEDRRAAGNTAGWVCEMAAYNPNTTYRITQYPFRNRNLGKMIGLSRNISRILRKRLHDTLTSRFEQGFQQRPISASRVLDYKGKISVTKLIPCFDAVFDVKSNLESGSHDLPLSAYSHFFRVISSCLACCSLILAGELIAIKSKARHPRTTTYTA